MRTAYSVPGFAITVLALLSTSAHAQFLYNGGAGEIEHAVYALNGIGPAAPTFAFDDGQLLGPGGF